MREVVEVQEKVALTLSEFCQRYAIGRSSAYREIEAGRLRIRKAGRRTLITTADADAWLAALPSGGRDAA